MAGGVNKVILIGHLGRDPEVRYTSSGGAVANFSIATTESWNDKSGQKQERTEWHKISVWGKLAELCGQYLNKGRQVYVEGRLQTREWNDKEGQKRYTTEIVAQNIQLLGGGQGGGQRVAAPATAHSDFAQSGGGGADFGSDMEKGGLSDDEVPF